MIYWNFFSLNGVDSFDTNQVNTYVPVYIMVLWSIVFICLPTFMPVAQRLKQRLRGLPPMQETWVRSLGWEDPLEKEMVTHSSILAWRIPWMEEPGGRLQSMGSPRVGHDWATSLHFMPMSHLSNYYIKALSWLLAFYSLF